MQIPHYHPDLPPGLHVAFYTGEAHGMAGIGHSIARRLASGPYTHTEFLLTDRRTLGSHHMDGGVRFCDRGYLLSNQWRFLPIPDPTGEIEEQVIKFGLDHLDTQYDYWWNLRFLCGLFSEDPSKMGCSEFTMAALGFPESWRYDPSACSTLLQHVYKTEMIALPQYHPK